LTKLEEPLESEDKLVLQVYDLGFVKDYKVVWDFQKELLNKRIAQRIPDSVIVVEHDHVITLGRSSHLENVLIGDLPTFEIERGGDVTYHGPGQLVAYPIVSLQEKNLGVRQFVELLEASIIDAITDLGIKNAEGKLGEATGVWIDNKRKIASIGVAVSHWVTYHGLALNVNTDLSYFQKIKPCGFESAVMTSLSKELQLEIVDMEKVKHLLLDSFSRRLGLSQKLSIAKI
jgi:lipoyl(octanoyl) transferase